MALHLTSNYTSAWELLEQNLKTMQQYKGNSQLQNELKEVNKGSIKNLLELEKNSLYGGTCFTEKTENKGSMKIEKPIRLIIDYGVDINKFDDIESMITYMKNKGMYKQLDEFAAALEKQGATELAAQAKDNKYYRYLKVKKLIEDYLDLEVGVDFEEQYSNLVKAVGQIKLHNNN